MQLPLLLQRINSIANHSLQPVVSLWTAKCKTNKQDHKNTQNICSGGLLFVFSFFHYFLQHKNMGNLSYFLLVHNYFSPHPLSHYFPYDQIITHPHPCILFSPCIDSFCNTLLLWKQLKHKVVNLLVVLMLPMFSVICGHCQHMNSVSESSFCILFCNG